MKSIYDSGGELAWIPSSTLRRDCDLVAEGETFGQLRWQSAFRATAIAACTEATWQFQLEGFLFRQWVTIQRYGDLKPEAVFQAYPSFNGVLEFRDGRAFHFDSNFWLTKWIWCDSEGLERIRMDRHLTLRTEGSLHLPADSLTLTELPLLTLLGWYLIQIVTDLRLR